MKGTKIYLFFLILYKTSVISYNVYCTNSVLVMYCNTIFLNRKSNSDSMPGFKAKGSPRKGTIS